MKKYLSQIIMVNFTVKGFTIFAISLLVISYTYNAGKLNRFSNLIKWFERLKNEIETPIEDDFDNPDGLSCQIFSLRENFPSIQVPSLSDCPLIISVRNNGEAEKSVTISDCSTVTTQDADFRVFQIPLSDEKISWSDFSLKSDENYQNLAKFTRNINQGDLLILAYSINQNDHLHPEIQKILIRWGLEPSEYIGPTGIIIVQTGTTNAAWFQGGRSTQVILTL